jgi:hypothetical protein
VRELARQHCAGAIEELARLAVKAKSETARVAAIRELLDRAYGKPTQYIEPAIDNLAHLTDEEVVAKLKEQMQQLGVDIDVKYQFGDNRRGNQSRHSGAEPNQSATERIVERSAHRPPVTARDR